MTDSATVNAARFADAVKLAASVAPKKAGPAFDQAAGVFVDFFLDEDGATLASIRATDTETWLEVVIEVSAFDSEKAVSLRLSSFLLDAICGQFPRRGADLLKISWEGSKVKFAIGRMRASLQLMPGQPPVWDSREAQQIKTVEGNPAVVNNLGQILNALEWSKGTRETVALHGILFSGKYAWSTCNTNLSRYETGIELPDDARFVIDTNALLGLASPGATWLHRKEGTIALMSQSSVIQCRTFDASSFPPLEKIEAKFQLEHKVKCQKSELLRVLGAPSGFLREDRTDTFSLCITGKAIGPRYLKDEHSSITDSIECIEGDEHEVVELRLNHARMTAAVSAVESDCVIIGYSPRPRQAVTIESESGGHKSWSMPAATAAPSTGGSDD